MSRPSTDYIKEAFGSLKPESDDNGLSQKLKDKEA